MTSPPQVEDFARWLWERDYDLKSMPDQRVPDNYLNEAAVFLAGPLGQQLQQAAQIKAVRELHQPVTGSLLYDYCAICRDEYGFREAHRCPTIKALDSGP